MEFNMNDRYLTPTEVAQMFRVDPKTVTRWAKAGKLPSTRTPGGLHMLPVSGSSKKQPRWQFNGNFEKPTISPSILTKFEHGEEKFICHSFVRNGVWQFLTDSTHDLAGKHVPMVDLPWWVTDA